MPVSDPFGRVEGRRVTSRESVAHPALSHRAAVRVPWARFLPPLSEPGVPISGSTVDTLSRHVAPCSAGLIRGANARHPGRPDLTLTGRRLARATPPAGLPVLVHSPLPPCRHYPGGTGRCSRRSLPDRWQPSPFEACSAFTRVVARVVAEPPIGVLQPMSLPPSSAPIPAGATVAGRDSHPLRKDAG